MLPLQQFPWAKIFGCLWFPPEVPRLWLFYLRKLVTWALGLLADSPHHQTQRDRNYSVIRTPGCSRADIRGAGNVSRPVDSILLQQLELPKAIIIIEAPFDQGIKPHTEVFTCIIPFSFLAVNNPPLFASFYRWRNWDAVIGQFAPRLSVIASQFNHLARFTSWCRCHSNFFTSSWQFAFTLCGQFAFTLCGHLSYSRAALSTRNVIWAIYVM